MTRRIAALAAVTAAGVAACGSDEPTVKPEAARATIEQAAHIKLASDAIPGEAREQGLKASYSNATTQLPSRRG